MRAQLSFLIGLCYFSVSAHLEADPTRTAVKGVPTILGREIERFLLLQSIDIDRTGPGMMKTDEADRMRCRVLPGHFIPVSEDAAGVYYQAANGVQRVGERFASNGGLLVSKKKEGVIFVYVGDAREPREALFRDFYKLSRAEVAKLKVGRSER
ncbi:MAG: hypothetical protein ABR589_12445 [Chthoniobacterales bacterium]